MRVHIVDPSAYTPPYDHALCHALGRAGAEVTLVTSRFAYGAAPAADGYIRRELFYRAALGAPGSRLRAASKLAQHIPDMLRYRRSALAADVVHFQWLPVQHLDAHLLPRSRRPGAVPRPRRPPAAPLVLTAHDILPREPRPGQRAAQRRLYERFDAIVVHSAHGRARLTGELGVDPARVHVIPHGVLMPLGLPSGASSLPGDASGVSGDASGVYSPPSAYLSPAAPSLPGAASAASSPAATASGASSPPPPFQTDLPVVLFFGLLRPYKGLDLLLEAWRGIEGAELWIVGMPRYDISALRRAAPANVRFLTRFVSDAEMAACFARADLAVLPYREADHSGVAFTALAAGVPLLLSDVGGFPELAATGVARTFPTGDPAALRVALQELLSDPAALLAMAARARAAARGPYAWEAIARRTLELYRVLRASF